MTENQNPEQKARDAIDALLRQAGWVVQSVKQIDLNAGLGQAVLEYQTDVGPADYVLFVDKKAIGVIEAKKEDLAVANPVVLPSFIHPLPEIVSAPDANQI